MIYEEGTVFRPRGGTLKTLLLLGIVCSSVSELFVHCTVQLSQNKMCPFVCLSVRLGTCFRTATAGSTDYENVVN